MKTSTAAAAFVLLLLASCAGTSPYRHDYPLTETSFVSRSGLLRGFVPRGWFTSSEDTLAPALDLWLLREDLAASVTLRELHLDASTKDAIDTEGLLMLAEISLALRTSPEPVTVASKPQCFTMSGHEWCGYELVEAGISNRIVVFQWEGGYYECAAGPLRSQADLDELGTIFSVQQTLLAAIVSR